VLVPVDVMAVRSALLDHVDTFWTRQRKELVRVGTVDGCPDLRVARMHTPDNPTDPWAHLTVGAWELHVDDGEGVELLLLAGDADPVHVDTLAIAVRRHAARALRLGDVVPLGRPWAPGSGCDHALVTLPYPYGATLERVNAPGFPIRIAWLVPITAKEAAFREQHGQEALERRLQDAAIDFLAVGRESCV
jgi:hypothetical protein